MRTVLLGPGLLGGWGCGGYAGPGLFGEGDECVVDVLEVDVCHVCDLYDEL